MSDNTKDTIQHHTIAMLTERVSERDAAIDALQKQATNMRKTHRENLVSLRTKNMNDAADHIEWLMPTQGSYGGATDIKACADAIRQIATETKEGEDES